MSIVAEQYEPQQESSIQPGDANPESVKEAPEFRPASPSEPEQSQDLLRIFAIDCCPHVVKALGEAPNAQIISVSSQDNEKLAPVGEKVSLIVVGISRFPVRRMF